MPKSSHVIPSRAVGYLRVSKEEQALSPVAQREAIVRWCKANDAELVAVFEDIDVSGGTPLDRRPGLLAAITELERKNAGMLVVAKRDRLARDVMNAAMVERLAERAGARIRSVAGEGTEGDLSDPSGMLMRGIVDLFAQYERAVIRARTKAALAVKAARGERTGQVRFGCRATPDGYIVEHEEEQKVLTRILELRKNGLSIRAIASQLQADGEPCRGTRWHPTTIARLITHHQSVLTNRSETP